MFLKITELQRETLPQYQARLAGISADSAPRWGRMSSADLFAHLRVTLECSMGEGYFRDNSNWFTRGPGRILFFHILPWPKGRLLADEQFILATHEEFDAERAALGEALTRFIDQAEREPERKTISPLLGPLTLQYWRYIHGRHFEHHFRQFGV